MDILFSYHRKIMRITTMIIRKMMIVVIIIINVTVLLVFVGKMVVASKNSNL